MIHNKSEAEIDANLKRETKAVLDAARHYAAKLLEAQIAGSAYIQACLEAGDRQAGDQKDPRQVLLFDMYRQRGLLKH